MAASMAMGGRWFAGKQIIATLIGDDVWQSDSSVRRGKSRSNGRFAASFGNGNLWETLNGVVTVFSFRGRIKGKGLSFRLSRSYVTSSPRCVTQCLLFAYPSG